jgi:hypothetical protein
MLNRKQALLVGLVIGTLASAAGAALAQDVGLRFGLGMPLSSGQTGPSPTRFFARANGGNVSGNVGGEISRVVPGGSVSQDHASSLAASPLGQSVTNPVPGRK